MKISVDQVCKFLSADGDLSEAGSSKDKVICDIGVCDGGWVGCDCGAVYKYNNLKGDRS